MSIRKMFLLFLAVTIVFLIGAAGMRGEQKPPRMLWEYKIVEFKGPAVFNPSDVEVLLGEQGSNGWELVGSEPDPRGGGPPNRWKLYTFKRAK